MALFQVILLRATVPFLIILAVKWSQESNLNYHGTLFCVLFSFAIWFLSQGYSNNRQGFIHWPMFELLYFSVLFRVIYMSVIGISENNKTVFYDNVLIFLDYRSIFYTVVQNIQCVISFAYILYRRLGIEPVQIVNYLTWISINSIFVVWLIDIMFTFTMTSAVAIFSKNMFYTFSENNTFNKSNTFIYPEGYINEYRLDPKDFMKAAYVTDTYRSSHKMTSFSASFSTHNADYPIGQRMIKRYVGEDVELDCSFLSSGKMQTDTERLVWFHNNGTLKKSQRHNVIHPSWKEGTDDKFKYHYTASLYIERLQPEDFGEYECVDENILQYGTETDIVRRTVKVFELMLISSKPRVLYRSVGSLVRSRVDFLYHSKADLDDISVRYTVNGQLLEDTCPGFDTTVCRFSQILYVMSSIGIIYIASDFRSTFPYLYIDETDSGLIKLARIIFCVCDKAFGIHKISFLHRYINERTKTYQTEEYEHPFKFILLPEASPSWLRRHDDTTTYTKLANFIKNENNTDIIEEEVLRVVDFISMSEKKVLLNANIVQSIVVIIGLSIYLIVVKYVVKIYLQIFNVAIIRYISSRAIQNQLSLAVEGDVPRLYISHSEDQNNLVLGAIVPFIEQECHQKVLSSQRDCIPGTNILHSFVDNINRSKQIIVIFSEAYVADPECYRAQLEHLIMPLLYETRIPLKNVLFIKYDYSGTIPQLLRWNFDVCVISWRVGLDNEMQLQRVKRWIATGDVN